MGDKEVDKAVREIIKEQPPRGETRNVPGPAQSDRDTTKDPQRIDPAPSPKPGS